jgi:hypothetical protein
MTITSELSLTGHKILRDHLKHGRKTWCMMTCPLEKTSCILLLQETFWHNPNWVEKSCKHYMQQEIPCQELDSGWISDHTNKMQRRIAWHLGLWKKLPLSGYNRIRSLSIILSNSAFRKYQPQTLSAKQLCVLWGQCIIISSWNFVLHLWTH